MCDGDGNHLAMVGVGGVTEHEIQQRILMACSRGSVRLWRNNVGTGWAGQAVRINTANLAAVAHSLRPGDVVIRQARPLHAGLCVGSSDLIGYRTLPSGTAQFVAIEVKAARGRVSPEQQRFLEAVRQAGGRADIARSVPDAQALVSDSY